MKRDSNKHSVLTFEWSGPVKIWQAHETARVPAEATYRRVAAHIRRRIQSGDLAPGDRIPSRHQICRELGVASTTVQRALELIRSEGLIEGSQRHQPTVKHPLPVRTLTEPAAPWPHSTGERHLSRTEAPPAVADILGLRIGARVQRERIELLDPDGRTSHLLIRYTSRLRSTPDAHAIGDLSGRAAAAGEAGMLGVAIGSMLLVVPVIRFSRDGRPAVVEELLLPADRWRVRLG